MKFLSYIILFTLLTIVKSISADGDRTIVRTIEFQERRAGWYDFPDDSKSYQQVLLHFKLRCPPNKPCGEWDYLSYVFLNQWYAPNFRVNKQVVENFSYMNDTSWNYKQIEVNGSKVIEKTAKTPVLVEFYEDELNPTKVTDSIMVWPQYYSNYEFDDNGKAIDSVLVPADESIALSKKRVFFNDEVTFPDRWEIFRYITPYGNGLDLGEGITWTYDVTDYIHLLKGKVYLESPNGGWGDPYDQNTQEDLELTFEFIEGTPPREVINITRMWQYYGLTYDKHFEEYVKPVEYTFSSNEKTAIMKIIQSGHGFGGTVDNCAEFCRKLGMAKVDNVQRYENYVWRDCGEIAVYPQGGTWIYDRSNWCPGAEVQPFNYELTPFISSGGTHSIDYDMEYYDLQWTGGSNTKPNWVITGFIVTYGDINHKVDARVSDIIAPNNDRIHNRYNPICSDPVIKIQNVGKDDIISIVVKYGNNPENMSESTITLDNPIKFMEEREIILSNNNYYDDSKPYVFYVELVSVNEQTDDNPSNNTKSSTFDSNIPEYFKEFVLELKTPNSNILGISSPIQYYIEDNQGNIVYQRNSTENSALYSDSIKLSDGCYRLTVVNTQGFGLGFWAYQQSGLVNGSLRFAINGATFKQFPTDWGNFLIHEFRVGDKPELLTNLTNDTLQFGDVLLGNKLTKILELSPKNSKGISIENINVVFGSSRKYTIIKSEPESTDGKYKINYGEKLILTFEFEPLSDGYKYTQVRIESNDFLNWQKVIILSGRGRDPNSIDSENIQENDLEAIVLNNSNILELNSTVNTAGIYGKFEIYDILGVKLFETKSIYFNDNQIHHQIDISNLFNGIYLASFQYNGNIKTVPFIIIK